MQKTDAEASAYTKVLPASDLERYVEDTDESASIKFFAVIFFRIVNASIAEIIKYNNAPQCLKGFASPCHIPHVSEYSS
jgi:hypothetical protein